MKRYLVIPGALFVFILFSAKTCKEDPHSLSSTEEDALFRVMDSVKNEFGTGYLEEGSLFVFTQKAEQKLRDYSDYRHIAGDTSLDTAFRAQASLMIKDLFYTGMEPAGSSPGLVIRIDSVWLIEPLHRTGPALYKGVLGFREESLRNYGQDSMTITPSMKKVEILATKAKKLFGADTLKVWTLFLGKIF